MKIHMGGTKICVSPRPHDGGITITQGTGRIRLTQPEAVAVVRAMKKMMPSGVEVDDEVDLQ